MTGLLMLGYGGTVKGSWVRGSRVGGLGLGAESNPPLPFFASLFVVLRGQKVNLLPEDAVDVPRSVSRRALWAKGRASQVHWLEAL
jgi:hypothetical protein